MPEKRPHKLTLHGHTRIDEYYWLRDDTRSDSKMLAYLEEENAHFDKVMEPLLGLQQAMYKEMTARLDPDESSVPYLRDGYWYYSRYEADSEYAIHARRKGSMDAEEEILLDGNQRAQGVIFTACKGWRSAMITAGWQLPKTLAADGSMRFEFSILKTLIFCRSKLATHLIQWPGLQTDNTCST